MGVNGAVSVRIGHIKSELAKALNVRELKTGIVETMLAKKSERQGRAVDQDREGSMEEKKKEGYF